MNDSSTYETVESLDVAIDELARAAVLLIATDFDGTIAPIESDPESVVLDEVARSALLALAAMPDTHVSIVSGRSMDNLERRIGQLDGVERIGSHGTEFSPGSIDGITAERIEALAGLRTELERIASLHEGAFVEAKPASVAIHFRNVVETSIDGLVRAVLDGPATWSDARVRHGKMVLEIGVVDFDKGRALNRLRSDRHATAVVYLGDDVTDEDGFCALGTADLGIKIGDGPTVAGHRLEGVADAARFLSRLAERRAYWQVGESSCPIDRHWLLSDQRTIALIDDRGHLCWLCLPRLDSSAVFAELLGGPSAGAFEIRSPSVLNPTSQGYLGDTFILETKWPEFTVVSYLDCSDGRALQRAGRTDLVRVVTGRGRVRMRFAPRLDFGRLETRLSRVDGGLKVDGSFEPLVLKSAGVDWTIIEEGRHHSAIAEHELGAEPLVLELRYGTANLAPSPIAEMERRRRVDRHWGDWTRTLSLPNTARDQVRRSALVLRSLVFGPTGAIAAAATTSLPESLGGERNWDYRFCWPRDGAIAASALVRIGGSDIAMQYLDWILDVLERHDESTMLRPLYQLTGSLAGSEGEIHELRGYRSSRPVRIGNGAAEQVQLDVLGPIADLIADLAHLGAPLSTEHWRLVETMVSAVTSRWTEPDHGIWEIRRSPRHHVHSKVMCWLTVKRGVEIASYLGHNRPEWERLEKVIAEDVLTHGWNEKVGAFTTAYGIDEIDAAALHVGIAGMISADDPRFERTVRCVERELLEGQTVYRYRFADGLEGTEGGFHLCTTWLIESLHLLGERERARLLFDAYLSQVGPTGLMAEEWEPRLGIALGNYPQAYSHAGLIRLATML